MERRCVIKDSTGSALGGFTCIISLVLHSDPRGRCCQGLHFTDKETEAQKGEVTCLRSQGWSVTEQACSGPTGPEAHATWCSFSVIKRNDCETVSDISAVTRAALAIQSNGSYGGDRDSGLWRNECTFWLHCVLAEAVSSLGASVFLLMDMLEAITPTLCSSHSVPLRWHVPGAAADTGETVTAPCSSRVTALSPAWKPPHRHTELSVSITSWLSHLAAPVTKSQILGFNVMTLACQSPKKGSSTLTRGKDFSLLRGKRQFEAVCRGESGF